MNEHFIRNIEIKNFKCFEDFKAEGFGRVNLIGGKNNVGKTAFMEACYLELSRKKAKDFVQASIILELHRNSLDFLLEWLNDYTLFKLKHINSKILINSTFVPIRLQCRYGDYKPDDKILVSPEQANIMIKESNAEKCELESNIEVDKYFNYIELNKNLLDDFYQKNLPPLISNTSFISIGNNFNSYLVNFIDEIKLSNRENDLNIALKNFFQIEKIDIIKNQVMLKKDKEYLLLSEFGDGVKHFLNIILSLYLNKDSILYLDEIENGIHYSNLDKLWEIILTISKDQNVQVFATTHSKECIESYARVAKKLDDEEIAFIELGRNKKNELDSVVMDSEMFQRFVKLGNEVRGW